MHLYDEEVMLIKTIYGNESVFQSTIVSKLAEEDKETQITEIRRAYKMARLQAIKNVTQTDQLTFILDYDIAIDDVLYLSDYTTTLTLTLTKETLLQLINDDRVISASLYHAAPIDSN